jgi:hypothetical protein
MQSHMGSTYSAIQMFIILYLFKCLDIKKLYFWVQIGRQILTCIPDPKKKQHKKRVFFLPTNIDAHMGREGGEGRKKCILIPKFLHYFLIKMQ